MPRRSIRSTGWGSRDDGMTGIWMWRSWSPAPGQLGGIWFQPWPGDLGTCVSWVALTQALARLELPPEYSDPLESGSLWYSRPTSPGDTAERGADHSSGLISENLLHLWTYLVLFVQVLQSRDDLCVLPKLCGWPEEELERKSRNSDLTTSKFMSELGRISNTLNSLQSRVPNLHTPPKGTQPTACPVLLWSKQLLGCFQYFWMCLSKVSVL